MKILYDENKNMYNELKERLKTEIVKKISNFSSCQDNNEVLLLLKQALHNIDDECDYSNFYHFGFKRMINETNKTFKFNFLNFNYSIGTFNEITILLYKKSNYVVIIIDYFKKVEIAREYYISNKKIINKNVNPLSQYKDEKIIPFTKILKYHHKKDSNE